MHTRQKRHQSSTAQAYNTAGRDYITYADGDPTNPFDFTGAFSYGDREIWARIDRYLTRLRAAGHLTLDILDAGCGPATWLRRTVLRARALGFEAVRAKGIDLSSEMIALARANLADIRDPGVTLQLEVADLTHALPDPDHTYDIALCLYAVLNHLPIRTLDRVAAELGRVTAGMLLVSVRAAGSLPSIYIDTLSHSRSFHQDNDANWIDIEMLDGRRLGLPSHLFTSTELRTLFNPHLATICVSGLDVFHSRFAGNHHWNPPMAQDAADFDTELTELEHRYASTPAFIDRATHILLVGER